MERRSPLYDYHSRNARKLMKGGGDYMVPDQYSSAMEEHANTRSNVGIQDLSTMGEMDIKGPDAESFLDRVVVNDIRGMDVGQVRYTTMCNAKGGVVDDVTIYRRGKEHFMIVTSSGPRKRVAAWLAEKSASMRAYVTDISGAIALPVVQGPRSREFLSSIAKECDLSALRFFRFTPARILETDVLISRSGYTGELGYEIYTPAEEVAVVWDALLESGKAFGLMPYAVLAMQTLRLEKAFPLYGVDITEEVTPFHLGLDRWIRFEGRNFIGRDALLRVRDEGVERRWVGLILEGDVAAAVRDEVVDESGASVGYVTYSNRGHTVERLLAMAYVSSERAVPGTQLTVRCTGGPVRGQVARTPFFDPEGSRIRA